MTRTQKMAAYLRNHGIPVISTQEPNDLEDGMVEITPTLHVQVQLFEGAFNTVRQVGDETFIFGKTRFHMTKILDDIKDHQPCIYTASPTR